MKERKNQREAAQIFAEQAPPLNGEELERINALFTPYLFRRTRTGEVWSTCCRTCSTPDIGSDVFLAEHQSDPRRYYEKAPAPKVACPVCGRPGIVKELRFTGKRYNLTSWRRAVVLRWHKGALWARAYDCKKKYCDCDAMLNAPECHLLGVYCFRPGRVKRQPGTFIIIRLMRYPGKAAGLQKGNGRSTGRGTPMRNTASATM